MFIFLDESGNFSGDKNNVFVVGGFITNEPKRTAKVFRKWQNRQFTDKKLRYRNELKFSDTRLTEKLRLKMLKKLTDYDVRVFYVFFKTKNIPVEYRKKGDIETGFLYAAVVEQALRLLLPNSDVELFLFRDNRPLKGISQTKFNEMLKVGLAPSLSSKTIFQVEGVNSAASVNVQIADWVCGALFRYYNKGKNGGQFFALLKNSIIASEELFKDYWDNFAKNKKSSS